MKHKSWQVGAQPGGHCHCSRIISNKYHKTKHFRWWNVFDDKCRMGRWSFQSWFDVNWWTFDEDMCDFLQFSFPVPLTFRPLDLTFAPLVTVVQRHVCTKLEVSMASLFRENCMHVTDGQTDDGVQHLMRPPVRGPHNNSPFMTFATNNGVLSKSH